VVSYVTTGGFDYGEREFSLMMECGAAKHVAGTVNICKCNVLCIWLV